MTVNLDYLEKNDRLVNLKTPDEENRLRLLPRTIADAVIETDEKQFISSKLKTYFYNKQENLGFTPLNKAGDTMTGALFLKATSFTQDNQVVSKKYIDDKFNDIIGSSSEGALDSIYELANAIGNDPNFAVTITKMIGAKLNTSEVTNGVEPNKIPRLDAEGELIVNTKGNAKTADRLKSPFTLSITGDFSAYALVDGSQDVSLNLVLPIASAVSSGIITPSDYIKLNSVASEVQDKIGSRTAEILSSSFSQNATTKLYEQTITLPAVARGKVGNVQTYQKINDTYEEVLTNIIVSTETIKVIAMAPFAGRLVYTITV